MRILAPEGLVEPNPTHCLSASSPVVSYKKVSNETSFNIVQVFKHRKRSFLLQPQSWFCLALEVTIPSIHLSELSIQSALPQWAAPPPFIAAFSAF